MSRIRVPVLFVVATLLAGLLGAMATPASAATVSSAHPYSDAAWYPLRVEANLDCVKNNPGCTAPHPNWMIDMVPTGQNHGISHAGVYSMAAGIVHIGDGHGASCGKETSYGTWIWIDHGAGRLSRYGHLGSLKVREGQYVAAGQQVGTVGTTGKRSNCHIAYVDFSVQRNGLKTTNSYEISSLYACTAHGRQSWPSAVTGQSRWNQVRQGRTFPASTGACIPQSAPNSPARPARVAAARGKGKLKIAWTRPPAASRVNSVMLEIAEYHPSSHTWDSPRNSRWVSVSASRTSVVASRLARNHIHRYRVSFHNSAGWSVASSWHKARTKK